MRKMMIPETNFVRDVNKEKQPMKSSGEISHEYNEILVLQLARTF